MRDTDGSIAPLEPPDEQSPDYEIYLALSKSPRIWVRINKPLGNSKVSLGALRHDAVLIGPEKAADHNNLLAFDILVEGLAGEGESALKPKMLQRVRTGEDLSNYLKPQSKWKYMEWGFTSRPDDVIKAVAVAVQKAKPIYNITGNNCQHFAGAVIHHINNTKLDDKAAKDALEEKMAAYWLERGNAADYRGFKPDDFQKLFLANAPTGNEHLKSPEAPDYDSLNEWVVRQYAEDSAQDVPKEG